MFLHLAPRAALSLSFLLQASVVSSRRCGLERCRDDQVCCAHGNDTFTVTCCRQFVDSTYYNIAMVTRKLSGMLILLLLFALGYFIQRALCSRSRQRSSAAAVAAAAPAVTTSLEPLVESCTPDPYPILPTDPGPSCSVGPRLPAYDACKRLPTYEECVRDDRWREEPGTSSGPGT